MWLMRPGHNASPWISTLFRIMGRGGTVKGTARIEFGHDWAHDSASGCESCLIGTKPYSHQRYVFQAQIHIVFVWKKKGVHSNQYAAEHKAGGALLF